MWKISPFVSELWRPAMWPGRWQHLCVSSSPRGSWHILSAWSSHSQRRCLSPGPRRTYRDLAPNHRLLYASCQCLWGQEVCMIQYRRLSVWTRESSVNIPEPSRSLMMYSSALSSNASSSAPVFIQLSIYNMENPSRLFVPLHQLLKYKSLTITNWHTSKLHVGYDDLLTDAGENILVFKEMLIVRPLTHWCQKLDSIAHKLQQTMLSGTVKKKLTALWTLK